MAHVASTLFFGIVLMGIGIAAQAMLRDHGARIIAALAYDATPAAPARPRATVVSVTRAPARRPAAPAWLRAAA